MVGVIASFVLAAVFLLAGASKIAAGPRWSLDARGLGAPPIAIVAVPWVELVIGGLLASRLAPRAVGALALVVLVAFSAVIARRLVEVRAGAERPACACFGAWSARPIGWQSLARNTVFAAIAVVVIAGG